MYLIHKYWARKPHNVVSQYIQRYSRPGEIVLDPFGGSGVTAMEAIKAGRKAISVDLNPMSAFLIENTLSRVDSPEIEEEFGKIEGKLKGKINDLYETKCPKCKQTAIVLATIWEKGKNKPRELRCMCPACKKYAAAPKRRDVALLEGRCGTETEKASSRTGWPITAIFFRKARTCPKYETIDALFTKRNLYALSLLIERDREDRGREASGRLSNLRSRRWFIWRARCAPWPRRAARATGAR